MINEEAVFKCLEKVLDPELGINIVDLGLIYDVKVKKDKVFVLMTLTFPGCPFGNIIKQNVIEKLERLKGVGKTQVRITFDPPWSAERMSESAKTKLGFTSNLP